MEIKGNDITDSVSVEHSQVLIEMKGNNITDSVSVECR